MDRYLYTVSLNIKNPRVHELARVAAERTGMSQTSVIELALERLLASLPPKEDDLDRLIADLQSRIAASGPLRTGDLYDEAGLPR